MSKKSYLPLLVLLAGCSGSETTQDTGAPDAQTVDQGPTDAVGADQGASTDGGRDAGSTDLTDTGPLDSGVVDAGPTDAGAATQIAFQDLQNWTRTAEPVYRDLFAGYQVAADPHVFVDEQGQLRMIYSGDVGDLSSIKMAIGTSYTEWTAQSAVISGPPSGLDVSRETSFYRHARDGTHQIYFIGYEDEAYRSQVYLAEALSVEGPYQINPTPVVPLGTIAGHPVQVLTSPSVVDHNGSTYLMVLGWDAHEEVTAVWVLGGVSTDDGRSFSNFQEVGTPIGMEGQVTKGPDDLFYATATIGEDGADEITLGRASHPFGPYEMLPRSIISAMGPPYEVNEANAAMITFDESTRTAHLFWHGANYVPDPNGNYLGGYWVMTASTSY